MNDPEDRVVSVGIDGSRGLWVAVGLSATNRVEWGLYQTIKDVCERYASATVVLIDMPIGLPQTEQEAMQRPERILRQLLLGKSRSVFPVPFRQQVYAQSRAAIWELNDRLRAKQTPVSIALCPAIRQVDEFLQQNVHWKNRLWESHPEYGFQVLNEGVALLPCKRTVEGCVARKEVLRRYVPTVDEVVQAYKDTYRNNDRTDDIIDALCLAVIGVEGMRYGFKTIPEIPCADSTGLQMHMMTIATRNLTK